MDDPLDDLSFLDVRRGEDAGPDEREPKIPPSTSQVLAGFCLAAIGAAFIVVMLVLALR